MEKLVWLADLDRDLAAGGPFIHNNIIFAWAVFDMALTLAGLLKDGDFWLSLFHSSLRICLRVF